MSNSYLARLLPGFRRKSHPRLIKPPDAAKGENPARPRARPQVDPEEFRRHWMQQIQAQRATVKHAAFDDLKMMDSLVAFLRGYLICDDPQLHILALWIVHTRCFQHFPTAAYLHIRSPEPESGKSVCMQLLKLLCDWPWLANGPTPETVAYTLIRGRSLKEITSQDGSCFHPPPFTILIDDCHHTFGPSERQQVVAMLNSGSTRLSSYVLRDAEYLLFGPKAFAGNAPLPASLAARCIPIVLRRKKPEQTTYLFNRDVARAAAANILQWLDSLANEPQWIIEKVKQGPPALPKWMLTAREKDWARPLLQIAGALGGSWPEKAAAAIIARSKVADCSSLAIRVLSDVRMCFFTRKDPEYLFSHDLLPWLGRMDYRPWAGWDSRSGKKLGHLLERFGIKSRRVVVGSQRHQGYLIKDFQDAWERYLQPFTAEDIAERDEIHASGGFQ